MPTSLPTNIDATYADSGTDASVKLHQQYHDTEGVALNRLTAAVFDPKEYGAVGDGVTDDSTAVSNAMDAANAASGMVEFSSGVYLTGIISKSYPARIRGRGNVIIQPTAATTNTQGLWKFNGSLGTSSNLTINAVAGTATATVVNGALFTVGQNVIVTDSTVVYDPQYTAPASGYYRYHGQQVQISAIAGNVLTFEEPLLYTFTTAATGYVQIVNSILDNFVEDITFYQPNASTTTGFLQFNYAKRCDVDVVMRGGTNYGLWFKHSTDIRARNRTFDFVYNAGAGGFAYSCVAIGACNHGYFEVFAYNGANAFTTTGADNEHGEPCNLQISGENVGSSTIGFSTHPSGLAIEFNNIHVVGTTSSNAGVECRSPGVVLNNPRIERCGRGVAIQDAGADVSILGGRFRDIVGNAVDCTDSTGMSQLTVTGVDMARIGGSAVNFNYAVTDLTVQANRFRDVGTTTNATYDIVSGSTTAGQVMTRCDVLGNVVRSSNANKTRSVVSASTQTHVACAATNNVIHDAIPLTRITLTGWVAPTTGAGANLSTT